ncbi:roadblock/LC7 domain-containing protein [Nucisporomicrobium flavum]|uniref:roadblock/LC7 domain-containing protein n=1 Tax=Nucisporomicrobium flavum TaxID=2785915 RepID=UPI0018F71829|nr:roadblock/LC7 domain-containing protein [Nucisporomicrobium flavum]
MTAPTAPAFGLRPDLSFLLDQFEARNRGAVRTVAVSADGMLLCASPSVDSQPQAETLAAICSGMTSLVVGLAKQLGAGPEADIGIVMDIGSTMIAGPFGNAYLMTLAPPNADMGAINEALLKLGESVLVQLSPTTR